MSILEAFILGIVQGLTEFLPVSSSGHTIIAARLMGIYEVPLGFELIIHCATLCAVVIMMRKTVLPLIKKPLGKGGRLVIIASIPTVIVALILKPFVESMMSGKYLVYCFLITAALLIITSFFSHSGKKELSVQESIIVGIVQGIAVIPGISRSGATICTAKILGNDTDTSMTFSFIISIPIIIGSSIVEIATNSSAIGVGLPQLLIGFFTAFFCGLIALRLMLKLFSRVSLDGFALYLTLLSAFIIVNDLFLHMF